MSPSITTSKLFEPIKVGDIQLQHRIVLAPLTRLRANKEHVHGDLAVEYYGQRASTPATLLISEGTMISPQAVGWEHAPGIWSEEQVTAWKRVTDEVHSKGCFIVVQIFAFGRAANEEILQRVGLKRVAPSAIPLEGGSIPHELTKEEISEYVGWFAQAARNGIRAGFDGVEIHFANGYLLDQFLQDTANQRTDEYGGSVPNRARFPLEVLDAVVDAIGEERTSVRFSPWSPFQGMLMKDPIPTFKYVVEQIAETHPHLMYLHFVEPRISGSDDDQHQDERPKEQTELASNDFARKIWAPRPFISAGGYSNDVHGAVKAVEELGTLVAFGRAYTSNPDLPLRLKRGIPLAPYNRSTFYVYESPIGYTDQPYAEPSLVD